jgi:hypothetical protein
LIAQSPDAENQAQVILRVKLVSVSPVEGSPDRFTPLIGQEIDLRTNKALLPSMAPGDTFTAEVIFRGGETNSYYFAENLQK